jgi:S-DNA-T family DNA segregation ATPase FtsK/SpoIIIE
VGKGDMLYHPIGANKALRVQGCLISDEEVAAVVGFVKENSSAQYDSEISKSVAQAAANTGNNGKSSKSADADPAGDYDELVPDAVDVLLDIGQASVSMLQRKLKLGYARAARLMDQMEELGYVGPFEGSKPRQLKITKEEWREKRAQLYGEASDQMEFDMNDAAMADDLLEVELPPDDSDEEPEDVELLDVPFDLDE